MPVQFILRFRRPKPLDVHGEIDENLNIELTNYDIDYDILMESMGDEATPVFIVLKEIRRFPLKYFFVPGQIMWDVTDLIICGLIRRSIELLKNEFGTETLSERIRPIELSLTSLEQYYKSRKRSTAERSRATKKAKTLLSKHIDKVEQLKASSSSYPHRPPNLDEDMIDICLWYMADLVSHIVKIHRPSMGYAAQQNADIATLIRFRKKIHEYNEETMSYHVYTSHRTNFLFILNRIIPQEDKDITLRASTSKECYDEVVSLTISLLGKYQDNDIAKKPIIVDPLYG